MRTKNRQNLLWTLKVTSLYWWILKFERFTDGHSTLTNLSMETTPNEMFISSFRGERKTVKYHSCPCLFLFLLSLPTGREPARSRPPDERQGQTTGAESVHILLLFPEQMEVERKSILIEERERRVTKYIFHQVASRGRMQIG